MRRAAVVTGLAVVLLMGFAPSASAHGDSPLVDDAVAITPGGETTYRGELHYHRLVADISADGPVTVRLLDTVGDSGNGNGVRGHGRTWSTMTWH